MKPVYLLLTVFLIVVSAKSQDSDITIKRFAEGDAPALNAIVCDMWKAVEAIEIPVNPESPEGHSWHGGQLRMAWNDTALFFLMEGRNYPFRHQWVTGKRDWESDRAQISLRVNMDYPYDYVWPTPTPHEYGFHWIVSDWIGNEADYDIVTYFIEFNHTQWPEHIPLHRAYDINLETGSWVWELVIPVKSLTYLIYPSDEEIAFDAVPGAVYSFAVEIVACLGVEDDFERTYHLLNKNGNWSMDTKGHIIAALSPDLVIIITDDATLTDLTIDGTTVEDFDPDVLDYQIKLPADTTDIPIVDAAANDEKAEIKITQATDLHGTATIEVTARDGETKLIYTIEFTLATDITDISSQLNVFPNPANKVLNIESDELIKQVKLFDIAGKTVMYFPVNSHQIRVGVNSLRDGLYFVQIHTFPGTYTKKLQIVK